jgi:hypothetical protein
MPAPPLDTVVSRIGETQAPLPASASVLIGLATLAAVGVQEIWLLAQHVNTIAHEGAHAIAGSAAGRTVRSVTMRGNGDGLTKVVGPGGAAGAVFFYVMGYIGPSAFGLGAAKLIEVGHSIAVLWLSLFLLAILLVVLRNAFGFAAVLVTGGLIYLIARYASVGANVVTAYAMAWFLLLSGVRVVVNHGVNAGDAGLLNGLTHIPRAFWAWLWLIGTVIALVVGGRLLL